MNNNLLIIFSSYFNNHHHRRLTIIVFSISTAIQTKKPNKIKPYIIPPLPSLLSLLFFFTITISSSSFPSIPHQYHNLTTNCFFISTIEKYFIYQIFYKKINFKPNIKNNSTQKVFYSKIFSTKQTTLENQIIFLRTTPLRCS